MKSFLSPQPIRLYETIAIVRMGVGMLLIYHGIEVFNPSLMKGYVQSGMVNGNSALFMVYIGKTSELTSGILLLFGFLTRLAAIIVVGTFSYITFVVGEGRFWYQEQHPFMFALFGLLYLFTGPGEYSVDSLIFKTKNKA
jgi:putative oxidoreductase